MPDLTITKVWLGNLKSKSKHAVSDDLPKCTTLGLALVSQETMALFRCFKVPKNLQDFLSHRIFGRMHGALNIGKNN
jgi:hypothetical protein